MKLGPLIFQDDVARLSLNSHSAQSGNLRMRCVAESKLLDFNVEKSCFVVFANKKTQSKFQNELSKAPLELCNRPMAQEKYVKYLGDYLSEKGLEDSVQLTVNKRKGLANKAIFEVRSILNDCRAHLAGGIVSGFNLWEMAVLPMLLYNAETWYEISQKTIDVLEKIQLNFLRSVLGVGSGCPLVLIYSETGMILMEYRILQRKLLFLHRL